MDLILITRLGAALAGAVAMTVAAAGAFVYSIFNR